MAKDAKSPNFRQIAALPYRVEEDGSVEVLLVTSRERGRWILPKGWPIKGMKDHAAAETEALEEAGITGTIGRKPIGRFEYDKRFPRKVERVKVDVFPLAVDGQLDDWREKGQREVRWFKPDEAAAMAADEGVGPMILDFAAGLVSEKA